MAGANPDTCFRRWVVIDRLFTSSKDVLNRLYNNRAWIRLYAEPDVPGSQLVPVPRGPTSRTAACAWSNAQDISFARLQGPRREVGNYYNRLFEARYVGTDYTTSCLEPHVLAAYNGCVPSSLRNHSWWTPLHAAAAGGHDDIIQLLLIYGANINAPSVGFCNCTHACSPVASRTTNMDDHVQWTPVHLAMCGGHDKTARELFRMRASFRIDCGQSRHTALFSASRHGCLATVQLLLRGGGRAHRRDHYGLPPLFHCLVGSQRSL